MPNSNPGDKNTSPRTERTASTTDSTLADLRATATHLAADDGPLAPYGPDFDTAFEHIDDLRFGLVDYVRRNLADLDTDDSETADLDTDDSETADLDTDDFQPADSATTEPPTDGELCEILPDPGLTVHDLDVAGAARTIHDSTALLVVEALVTDPFPEDCKPVRYGALELRQTADSTWSVGVAEGAGPVLDYVHPTRYKSASDLQANLERLDRVVRRLSA